MCPLQKLLMINFIFIVPPPPTVKWNLRPCSDIQVLYLALYLFEWGNIQIFPSIRQDYDSILYLKSEWNLTNAPDQPVQQLQWCADVIQTAGKLSTWLLYFLITTRWCCLQHTKLWMLKASVHHEALFAHHYCSNSRVCFHNKTWFRDRIELFGDRVVVSSCSV